MVDLFGCSFRGNSTFNNYSFNFMEGKRILSRSNGKSYYELVFFEGVELGHFLFLCIPSPQESTRIEKNLLLQEQILSCKSRPRFAMNTVFLKKKKKKEKLQKNVAVYSFTVNVHHVLSEKSSRMIKAPSYFLN